MKTIYRTEDGQEFADKYDAQEHEREWEKREAFRVPLVRFAKSIAPTVDMVSTDYLVDWVTDHRQLIHDLVHYPSIAEQTVDEALGIKRAEGE